MEVDAVNVPDPGADGVDHPPHVVGRAIGIGLDEVRVLGRHLGRADPVALQTGRVDEAAGGIARRVGEDAPGVLTTRLVGSTPTDDLADLGLRLSPTPLVEIDLCEQHDVIALHRTPTIGQIELADGPFTRPAAEEVEDADPDEVGGDVRTVTTGVHPHRTTDRARHADRPLEAGEPGRRGTPGGDRQERGRAEPGSSTRRIDRDLGERVPELHHEAVEPAVGDEQVRPLADDQGGHVGALERDPDRFEIGDGVGLDEHRGGAADLVGAQRSERDGRCGEGPEPRRDRRELFGSTGHRRPHLMAFAARAARAGARGSW